jgi:hypothetical protein
MFRPGIAVCQLLTVLTAVTLVLLPASSAAAQRSQRPSFSLASRATASRRTVPVRPTPKKTAAKPAAKNAKRPTPKKSVLKTVAKATPKKAASKKVRILPPGFNVPPPGNSLSVLVNGPVEIVAAGKGRINYEVGLVKAVGLGAVRRPSVTKSRGQDVLEAREAAIADAIRILGMTVSEVRVTSETRVKNFVLEQDDIRLKVAEFIRGAEILEEKLLGEVGIYRVVVQAKLTGPDSLQATLAPTVPQLQPKAILETPPIPQTFAPGSPAPHDAKYTSLIIDCRGLKVNACMSPRLYSSDGSEIYGTMKISPDYVIETGIAAFPRSMDEAKRGARTGERPLIVRAHRVADDNRFYPVISKHDAERVREANESGHFFERTAVIFVLDPVR